MSMGKFDAEEYERREKRLSRIRTDTDDRRPIFEGRLKYIDDDSVDELLAGTIYKKHSDWTADTADSTDNKPHYFTAIHSTPNVRTLFELQSPSSPIRMSATLRSAAPIQPIWPMKQNLIGTGTGNTTETTSLQ